MINEKLLTEVHFLLEEAEERVWRRSEKVILDLYWHLGYCLKEYSKEEIKKVSKELALLLNAEQEMFLTAYTFYRENPLKKKALRLSA